MGDVPFPCFTQFYKQQLKEKSFNPIAEEGLTFGRQMTSTDHMEKKYPDLFAYNHEMNMRLLTLLETHRTQVSEKTLALLSHTFNAHQIWNARILKQLTFQVWQLNDWHTLPQINQSNYENTLLILKTIPLQSFIEYHNSKGEGFFNTVDEILFHIINHSTYHRAQIATECRLHGIEPLSSDYILFKRK